MLKTRLELKESSLISFHFISFYFLSIFIAFLLHPLLEFKALHQLPINLRLRLHLIDNRLRLLNSTLQGFSPILISYLKKISIHYITLHYTRKGKQPYLTFQICNYLIINSFFNQQLWPTKLLAWDSFWILNKFFISSTV